MEEVKNYLFSKIEDYILIFTKKYGYVENLREYFIELFLNIVESNNSFYIECYEKKQEKNYTYLDHYVLKYIYNTIFIYTKSNKFRKNFDFKTIEFEDNNDVYEFHDDIDFNNIMNFIRKQKNWKWRFYEEYLFFDGKIVELINKYNFKYKTFYDIKKFCESKLKKKFK